MSDTVINVANLSKSYVLAHQASRGVGRYERFGDVILNAAKAPFRAFGKRHEPGPERETFWALRDVSFEIKRGEVVGIIGRNGAGKSTLLKILSRITEPTSGRVEIEGRVASLLEVGTGFHAELTGRENIFLNGAILGMGRGEIKKKFDEIVAFAEVEQFLDTPVKRYSSGMYVRLAFAVAAHLEPEILIVDEVLAVGDAQFQKKCLGKMQDVSTKEGRTVLFVSHNMGAVMNLCHRGIVMEKGRLAFQSSIGEAIDFYNHSALRQHDSDHEPHVLYREPKGARVGGLAITKIEMLQPEGRPKPILGTWDDVVFRITYRSDRKISRASVVLQINLSSGTPLVLLSTEPDGTLPLDLTVGERSVDCAIDHLPLAAGEYILGAGLAIPNAEWLWRNEELAVLAVAPRDVYASGLAPSMTRALIAPHHRWKHASSK